MGYKFYTVGGKLVLSGGKIVGTYYTTWDLISVGGFHTSALIFNQVWGWGYNNCGQLGDNTTTSRLTPISILGSNKSFCSIASGFEHSTGIDKNGQVWGWGDNNYGQLGDNTTICRCSPVSILGFKKTFCKISNGIHTSAIDKNGQVWGWGNNGNGNLGDNTQIDKWTPVSILGAKKTFCKIFVGFATSMGIDKNGQAWGWGYNGYANIGDNTQIDKYTPVSILGSKKTFCNISTNYHHSMGIDKYGQVWGWGYNGNGQIGDNTEYPADPWKFTPVSILGSKKTFCH